MHFKLTELDATPLSGCPVRVVVGDGWQDCDAGKRFVTDANGEHHFITQAFIDKRSRKMPTNFMSSLVSRKQITDHLTVAAELGYLTFRWLYAVDVYRFPDGTSALLDGFSVYSADAAGRFTHRAVPNASGWRMAGLEGLVLTTPGYQPWGVTLEPSALDPAQLEWTLRIAFQRQPEPVRR
ncbi:MAG: hypothetical protein ACREOG_15075 [Gemmatimonadaceae bacterium]